MKIFNGKYLGSCESLLNVSREEIIKRVKEHPGEINTCKGNLPTLEDYLKLDNEFVYRFPYEEEVNDTWEEGHKEHNVLISVDPNIIKIPHKNMIQTSVKGKTYTLPFCPASDKAYKPGVKTNNHCNVYIKIYGQKYTPISPTGYTLFECVACGAIFALNRKETLYIRDILSKKGFKYEAEQINYPITDDLSLKAKLLTDYANENDDEGIIYSYEDSLKYILSLEDEEDRDIPIDEIIDYLSECHFCGM